MKRVLDLLVCLIVLPVLLLPGLVIVVLLRLTGEKRAFYFQPRVGKGKQLFTCWKLVTMRTGSERTGTGAITIQNDPRVTPLGRFLRKTKINELPQFINVLKGDMTLVGPRPLTVEGFGFYTPDVQDVIARVKPGLTGIGSVVFRDEEALLGRSDVPYEQVYRERISPIKGALECWYIEHQSLRLDLLILFLTAVAVVHPRSTLYRRLLKGLPEEACTASPKPRPKLLYAVTSGLNKLFIQGQLADARSRGFEVYMMSAPDNDVRTFVEAEGATYVPLRMRREMALWDDLWALAKICRELRRIRPTVVNAGTPKAGLLVMIAAWVCRVPCRVFTLHGLRSKTLTGPMLLIVRGMERLSCRLAHRVVCVSPSLMRLALELSLTPQKKAMVPGGGSCNGVDTIYYSPTAERRAEADQWRTRLKLTPGAPVIGFVGRICLDKGVCELLDAWLHLRQSDPSIQLLFVGPDEDTGEMPEKYRAMLRNEPAIHKTGMVADPAPLYLLMDVLALPSYREGFGNVLLEAAAMERPTVATHVEGCMDAVTNGVTGTLVKDREWQGLADALRRYLEDPELRRQHGRAGRERAIRDFSQPRIWAALMHEYEQLMRKRGLRIEESRITSVRAAVDPTS